MTRNPEDNYSKHQHNPGPSKESLKDPNDEKAGKNINWVIIVAVILLIIAFFLIFEKTSTRF